MNKQKQIIVVIAVFVIAIASLGTIIGLIVNTGQMSDYSDGFSYTLNGTRATITGYDGSDTDVVIPDRIRGNRVVAVSKGTFSAKASSIKTITFESSIDGFELGDEVFKDLTALTKVVLPSGLKEIPKSAFDGCKALTTVIMPDGITKIGEEAFENCTALKTANVNENYGESEDSKLNLPNSLLEIGQRAFYGCTSLVSLVVDKSLEKIGNEAFSGCNRLSDFAIAEDNEVTSIGNSAFYGTIIKSSDSAPLNFPNLISIGEKAFASIKSSNFKYFKFADSVESIGKDAFNNSTSLKTVEFGENIKLDTMGEGVFQDATSLDTITLPESLTSIPARTFMGCTRLLYNKDFVVGKNIATIGDGAFAIYTNTAKSTSVYTNKKIVIEEGNEYFAVVELKDYKKGETTKTHSILVATNYDESNKLSYDVIAYIGEYNKESTMTDSSGITKSSFRFLDSTGNAIKEIKNINSYAFAGIKFEYIQLPITLSKMGNMVFYATEAVSEGEHSVICYISAIGWEWEDDTFVTEEEGKPNVIVMIATNENGVDEFIDNLNDYVASAGKANDIP